MVKGDKGTTGKTNKFEYASAYLTPWDPVDKDWNTNKKRGSDKSLIQQVKERKSQQPEKIE